MFKPMLASKCEDITKLSFPLLASPKLDGVRCHIIGGRPMSRNLKMIPNKAVQEILGGLPSMDGELVVGSPTAPTAFTETMSGVMSAEGVPEFVYYVFDVIINEQLPFSERNLLAKRWSSSAGKNVRWLPHQLINDVKHLEVFEDEMVQLGYEGIMVRSLDGPYKNGRSTAREGYLLKIKRFEDSEAIIISYDEKMHNDNELTKDELGRAKRTSHKANKRNAGVLGSLAVSDVNTDVSFEVGAGFTDADRAALWARRETLAGKIIKYRFQPAGVKEKPRFPVFIGFRDEADMS